MYGQCWKGGKWGQMEPRHIFEGVANRKKSEEYGLVVLLCGEECHRNGREAAHRCGETALRLHRWGQRSSWRSSTRRRRTSGGRSGRAICKEEEL